MNVYWNFNCGFLAHTGTEWCKVVAVFPQIQNKDSLEVIFIN